MKLIKQSGEIFIINIKLFIKYLIRITKITKRSRKDNFIMVQHKESIREFKKALEQFSYSGFKVDIFINAYENKSVKPVKLLQPVLKEKDPVLLCITKDNIHTIKSQVEYHRKLGIKCFAYIDNMSQDGTFEWLKDQPDVSLFYTEEIFNDSLKDAWKRQVTDFLGYDRWYLALDPDELFIYPGIEKKNINMFIDFLEDNNIKSVFSPLLDMYSNEKIYQENEDTKNMIEKYCYFDTDTYKMTKSFLAYHVFGGPRLRLFSTKEKSFLCSLEKYALIKLTKDMLIGTHQNYPNKHNFYTKGAIAFLLHYKFLPADNKKFKELLESGIFSHNKGLNFEYKRYVEAFEKNSDLTFFYEKSQKINSSMDLLKINIIDKNVINKLLDD